MATPATSSGAATGTTPPSTTSMATAAPAVSEPPMFTPTHMTASAPTASRTIRRPRSTMSLFRTPLTRAATLALGDEDSGVPNENADSHNGSSQIQTGARYDIYAPHSM